MALQFPIFWFVETNCPLPTLDTHQSGSGRRRVSSVCCVFVEKFLDFSLKNQGKKMQLFQHYFPKFPTAWKEHQSLFGVANVKCRQPGWVEFDSAFCNGRSGILVRSPRESFRFFVPNFHDVFSTIFCHGIFRLFMKQQACASPTRKVAVALGVSYVRDRYTGHTVSRGG